MRFELDLPWSWVKDFMIKHDCSKPDILHILAASLLEDKESQYYRNLDTEFDIDEFLLSKSISELAVMRSIALGRKTQIKKMGNNRLENEMG